MKLDRPGLKFEKAVAAIQSRFDPGAKVTHNERIRDRAGIERQFDVVVRGTLGGYSVLGVIECKDTKKRVGLPLLDAFHTKALEANANLKIVVSRRGFSESAVEKAKQWGIETLSLLPSESSDDGFLVGTMSIVDLYSWSQLSVQLHYEQNPLPEDLFGVYDVLFEGKRVIDWFTNELTKNYSSHEEEGPLQIQVPFEADREFTVSGVPRKLSAITFTAVRQRERKMRAIGFTGDAFYDWQQHQIKVPPNSPLRSHSIPLDFSRWVDVDSNSPLPTDAVFDLSFVAHIKQLHWVSDAVDLEAL